MNLKQGDFCFSSFVLVPVFCYSFSIFFVFFARFNLLLCSYIVKFEIFAAHKRIFHAESRCDFFVQPFCFDKMFLWTDLKVISQELAYFTNQTNFKLRSLRWKPPIISFFHTSAILQYQPTLHLLGDEAPEREIDQQLAESLQILTNWLLIQNLGRDHLCTAPIVRWC